MPEPSPPNWAGLLRLITGKWATHALYAAVELGLAETMKDGPRAAEEIASRTGSNSDFTCRLLRALAAIGVIDQISDDTFALNSCGRLLCNDEPQSMTHVIRMFGSPWHNRIWEAMVQSARSGGAGAEHAFGMSLWSYFDANTHDLENFNAAMTEISDTVGATAVDACDFSGIEILVDVGGGAGRLLSRVLQRYPKMRGIVFDRPALEGEANLWLDRNQVRNRCKFVGGDFLHSVPPGADGYMMSHILHDWSDSDAITILGNCRSAMRSGLKLRIFEGVVKPAGEHDWGGLLDLEMIAMFGGRERSADEFAGLFEKTGFALGGVTRTTSPTSIIEAIAI